MYRTEVRDLRRRTCRSRSGEAGGSLSREVTARVGAAPTTTGRVSTARWRGSGKRDGKEHARNQRSYVLRKVNRLESGGSGPGVVRTRRLGADGELSGWLVDVGPGGHGEVLRGNHWRCHRDRVGLLLHRANISERGNRLDPRPRPRTRRGGWGWVHRRPNGSGRGGAVVVLRAGESPCTWGRAAAVSRREGCCNAERGTTEWWRSAGHGPDGATSAGIGDAGQASPLGGGRPWP